VPDQYQYSDNEPGRYVYWYATAATTAITLDTGQLRFGTYAQMNDPRENQRWWPSFSVDDEAEDRPGRIEEASDELDRVIRQGVRLKCFTIDAQDPFSVGGDGAWHNGWARARMWQQYADEHRGACLVLDRQALLDQVRVAARRDRVLTGQVAYADKRLHFHFALSDIRGDALLPFARAERERRADELYFLKNLDWASEREYRMVVLSDPTDKPLYVNFTTALRGIVVGEAFPDAELSVLRTRLARIQHADMPVARCIWFSGAPQVVPSDAQPPGI